MTIKEYNGKGHCRFVVTDYRFDDVVCLFVFSIMVAVVNAQGKQWFSILRVLSNRSDLKCCGADFRLFYCAVYGIYDNFLKKKF